MSMLPGKLRAEHAHARWANDSPMKLVAPHTRAIEIGTAAEHLVCADLILSGYRAFLSAQGLPYDLILDHSRGLFKVTVKSTLKPTRRTGRINGPIAYSFNATKTKRDNKGKSSATRYTTSDADIIAFVALDIRMVAYAPIGITCWHIFPPGTVHSEFDSLGRRNGHNRKRFEELTLAKALTIVCERADHESNIP